MAAEATASTAVRLSSSRPQSGRAGQPNRKWLISHRVSARGANAPTRLWPSSSVARSAGWPIEAYSIGSARFQSGFRVAWRRQRADQGMPGPESTSGDSGRWPRSAVRPGPRDWDAVTYDRVADHHARWGSVVLDRGTTDVRSLHHLIITPARAAWPFIHLEQHTRLRQRAGCRFAYIHQVEQVRSPHPTTSLRISCARLTLPELVNHPSRSL
jgi:hypothetical protein